MLRIGMLLTATFLPGLANAQTNQIPAPAPSPVDVSTLPDPADDFVPSGTWTVDFADDGCHVGRNFKLGNQTLMLAISQRGILGRATILIAGEALGSDKDVAPRVVVARMPQATASMVNMLVGELPDKRTFIRWDIDADRFFEDIRDDQRIILSREGGLTTAMRWDGAAKVAKVLKQCHDDYLSSKGVDAVALRAQKSPPLPVGNPANWLGPNAYPTGPLSKGGIGNVAFELTVDTQGKVKSCTVLIPSGWQQLDQEVCRTLPKRAKFKPAIGSDGAPVDGYYASIVRFQIPK